MSLLLENPVEALRRYVAHPSVSADSSFSEGVTGARDCACSMLRELGFSVELVDTPIHPVIVGTRGDPSWPGIVIYGHYDVQPPDPLEFMDFQTFRGRRKRRAFIRSGGSR